MSELREWKHEDLIEAPDPNPYYLKTDDEILQEFRKQAGNVSLWHEPYRRSYLTLKQEAELGREIKQQLDRIDPELSRLIFDWKPRFVSLLKFYMSVASYPYRKKIEQLKAILKSPDSYSVDSLRAVTKILLGRIPYSIIRAYVSSSPFPFAGGMSAPEITLYETEASEDPNDPDAPILPPSLLIAEMERRQRWRAAWERELSYLKQKYSYVLDSDFKFWTDLPTSSSALIRTSPRLRLPSGEYLEPVTGTISSVAPVTPQPLQPVAEEKKEEKKSFPWWIVVVIGVMALFFIMKD
jgi:hypothetical protein